jgi:nitroimidazol reductase NimA-like FMN-containing flavoprotein (pyridoxamine 5'-phosphate oxidase superfamily)
MSKTKPKSDRPHMPGYGISGVKKGMLTWSWAEKRLSDSRNYYIATVRPDGRPHVMPVWGVWLDNQLFFSTGVDSRKHRNLTMNPRCVIVTEDATEPVIVEGTAAILTNQAALKRFGAAYKKKYDWNKESDGGGDPGGLYIVEPDTVFAFIEAADKFGSAATRWTF